MDALQELRMEYIANFYANKFDKAPNKEEILQQASNVLEEIIAELKDGQTD